MVLLSNKLFVLSLIIAVIVLIYIICLIRSGKLLLKHSLIWIFAALAFVILAIFPQILSFLTKLMGIEWPIHALFFIEFLFLLIALLVITITISNNSEAIKELSQGLALLEDKIDKIQRT